MQPSLIAEDELRYKKLSYKRRQAHVLDESPKALGD